MVPCFPLLGLTPCGLFMGLSSTLIYTSELILCFTICVPSATRHNIRYTPVAGPPMRFTRMPVAGWQKTNLGHTQYLKDSCRNTTFHFSWYLGICSFVGANCLELVSTVFCLSVTWYLRDSDPAYLTFIIICSIKSLSLGRPEGLPFMILWIRKFGFWLWTFSL